MTNKTIGASNSAGCWCSHAKANYALSAHLKRIQSPTEDFLDGTTLGPNELRWGFSPLSLESCIIESPLKLPWLLFDCLMIPTLRPSTWQLWSDEETKKTPCLDVRHAVSSCCRVVRPTAPSAKWGSHAFSKVQRCNDAQRLLLLLVCNTRTLNAATPNVSRLLSLPIQI